METWGGGAQLKGKRRGLSGTPLLHRGLVAGDGLGCVHTSAVAVHALKVGVTQRSEGRYSPGRVEGEELLRGGRGKEDYERPPSIDACLHF